MRDMRISHSLTNRTGIGKKLNTSEVNNSVMRNTELTVLILCSILLLQLCCCVHNSPTPDNIYSDSYTASSTEQYKPLNSESGMTEKEAINTALSNNPGYKIKQLKAVSAEADYYSSLTNLTPNISISNNNGLTTNYQASPSSIMNVQAAKAAADKTQYAINNYHRKMVKDISITYSDIQKYKSIAAIQRGNEKFQKEMTDNILREKKSTTDILNFRINELKAKTAVIEAEKNYKTNSYALAAKMGVPGVELPADTNTQKSIPAKNVMNDENKWLDLSYYLDMAIKNRPDLKTHIEAIRAAKYDLYSAAGVLTPTVTAASGNSNSSVSTGKNINLGSNIAGIRSKYANYAAKHEDLKKKWISIIKEVKEAYLKLTIQLAVRKKMEFTMQIAKQRRDLVAKQYNAGKTENIAIINQVQKDLISAQKSFIKAEKYVGKARVNLYAACGVSIQEPKKPSIAILNEAQQTYVETQKNYLGSQIEVLKQEAKMEAATGMQH